MTSGLRHSLWVDSGSDDRIHARAKSVLIDEHHASSEEESFECEVSQPNERDRQRGESHTSVNVNVACEFKQDEMSRNSGETHKANGIHYKHSIHGYHQHSLRTPVPSPTQCLLRSHTLP